MNVDKKSLFVSNGQSYDEQKTASGKKWCFQIYSESNSKP